MPPINDNFANRITLTGNSINTTGSNVGATAETGEPDHAGVPSLNSVWWTWTAPSTGTVAMNTYGSHFDTTLAIYTGSAVNSLTEVVSNDNFFSDGYLEYHSVVTFTAIAGTTYQIAVDGGSTTGLINLDLDFRATPFATRAADFGFESGNFTNWVTIGNANIQTAAFGTYPTEGNYQASLTTDSASDSASETAIENFLGLSAGTLDSLVDDPYEYAATNGSALKLTTISVNAGDVLSFDWNLLQSETFYIFNNFAFVSIAPGLVFKLADLSSTLSSSIFSPTPFYAETGYQTFEYKFTTSGTYTVGIGVMEVEYAPFYLVSGLLVDNLNIFSEILGTSSNDCLNGTGGNERIKGLEGNDKINGNGGYDTLLGGVGKDTIAGAAGNDYIDGGDGNDTIYGNGGRDRLIGDAGNDRIYGGSQADEILGGVGNDTIYGNGGNDLINSGSGTDTVYLGAGRATVVLEIGAGFDTIKNFQLGQTKFKLESGLTWADLTFINSDSGARISFGSDILAVVSWNQASTINNPNIFV